MERVAKFEKVSVGQFAKDMGISEADAETILHAIPLPKRSTAGSAGYDICTSKKFTLAPGESIKIPTGIRCKITDGWFLMICPRSGLGFKYKVQLDNTVGIIDADYYNADNEGHIMIKLTNDNREGKTLSVDVYDRIAQGIFLPYGITEDDDVDTERTGGFGSTGR